VPPRGCLGLAAGESWCFDRGVSCARGHWSVSGEGGSLPVGGCGAGAAWRLVLICVNGWGLWPAACV